MNTRIFGFAAILCLTVTGFSAMPLENWHFRRTEGPALRSVAYGNGTFVAVGEGVVLASCDGVAWDVQEMGTNVFEDVIFAQSIFVAAGHDSIHTSPDGTNWTIRYQGSARTWPLAYGNGRFITPSLPYQSPDGVAWLLSYDGFSWIEQSAPPERPEWPLFLYTMPARQMVYGNGSFVAWCESGSLWALGGGQATLYRSTNGLNWAKVWAGCEHGDDGGLWLSLNYGKHGFSLIGFSVTGRAYACELPYSTDGLNWDRHNLEPELYLDTVRYGGGVFVGFSRWYDCFERARLRIHSSLDGVSWAPRFTEPGACPTNEIRINDAVYGNGTFVAVGQNNPDWRWWESRNGVIVQSDSFASLDLGLNTFPELIVTGPRDQSYRLEYADSLGTTNGWKTLATITVTNESHIFTDTGTNSLQRFYRAILLPRP